MHENGTVEQVVHYYPFGGTYADAGVNWSLQMYKYNGKELDRMHGLDWYDYGARMYDAVLTGWTSMDPLSEEYYHVSPYVYCLNNPVNAIDPDGRKVRIYGNRSERIQILTYLQMLTNDKLGVNQNGFVTIMNKNSKNQDKNLEVGTKLLGSIVNDSHLATFYLTDNGGSCSVRDKYRLDAYNGKGTDVYIFIDPQVTNRETLNFSTKTKNVETGKLPIQVAIGHELIHSIRSMKGIAKPHKYVRYDYRNVNMNYMEDVADIEELETIGIIDGYKFTENMIRKEQGESSIRIKY